MNVAHRDVPTYLRGTGMPKTKVKKRGGSVRTVTIKLPGGKFKHCDVTRKPGPRGGKTVCGPTRKKKRGK